MNILRRYRHTGGFTLVELMAVMVIIAILVSMIIGIAGYAKRAADEARAKSELEKLQTAAQDYMMKYGGYPNIDPSTDASLLWNVTGFTNFLKETVSDTDPWGNDYQYIRHSRNSGVFYSFGYDKTQGNDDDIHSGR